MGNNAAGEVGQVFDDDEIRQYHREIQNHYAQQNLAGHQGLAQQPSVGHQAYSHAQTSDVHSVASSSGKIAFYIDQRIHDLRLNKVLILTFLLYFPDLI